VAFFSEVKESKIFHLIFVKSIGYFPKVLYLCTRFRLAEMENFLQPKNEKVIQNGKPIHCHRPKNKRKKT